ncbi:hypothetical protein M569_00626 [Genlisea aurea]|uniref:Uncharacterized protein n=1 Tax=Genlisea aurea TaxID=192259 RepID=S8D3Z1_9LAMI|nr:hypothetical protein M569_00626 [Genlisea aurea]
MWWAERSLLGLFHVDNILELRKIRAGRNSEAVDGEGDDESVDKGVKVPTKGRILSRRFCRRRLGTYLIQKLLRGGGDLQIRLDHTQYNP